MRKIFAIWLCALLVMGGAIVGFGHSTEAATVGEKPLFSGTGSGIIADPYIITTVGQLQEMNNGLNAYYVLGNDIDATDTLNWNSGAGFLQIGTLATQFTGNLNGNGYKINGLFINRPGVNYVSLIGYLNSGGVAGNLSLSNVNITANSAVGGLIGQIGTGGALVYNSCTSGNVSGFANVGGLVGNNRGNVSNCYAMVNVTGTGGMYIGGLAGINYGVNSKIINSFSTGKVNGGGLIATNQGTVTDSFWDTESSGQIWSAAGTGKTTSEMLQQATFASWDFADTWGIDEGVSYPYLLAFQSEQPDDINTNWEYRKPITISSTGTALTNYQVPVTVSYETGMQPDFDDLRFTDSDGVTFIDHWLESKTDSTTAKVWVEVPAIPATGGTTIYMYFGNDAAFSVSNGTATFVFFDDFLGTALDPAKWAESSNSGTYSVSGSVLTTTSSGGCELIKSVSTFSARNMAFHTRARSTGSSGYLESYLTNFNPSGDPYGFTTWYRFVDGYNYGEQIARYSSSGQSELFRASTSHFTSWTHLYMSIGSSNIALGWDDSQKATESCAFGAGDALRFDIGQWAGSSAYFDWAFVSKFASPSPTATIGNTQSMVPVATWALDEGTGQYAYDTSGNGNTGTLVNSPSWSASGVNHGAIHFDGIDDIVNCGADASLDPTAAATIEAWVKFDILPSATGRIFHIAGRSGVGTDLDLLASNTNNRFRFYIGAGKSAESTTVIQVGIWYHVVGTYLANNHVSISVNGILEQTTPISVTRGTNPNYFTIGESGYWSDRTFQGTIDEVSVWERSLDAGEVLAQFNMNAPVHNLVSGEYFTTIQGAINDAQTLAGHTITVEAGTYIEKLTVSKRLTIQGAGMGNTTINGGGTGNVISVTANWVNITGFKITGSGTAGTFPNVDAGIAISSVQYCWMHGNNLTGNRNGLTINGGGRHRVSENQIRTSGYDSVLSYSSTYNRFDNNTIIGFGDIGISFRTTSSYGTVDNNTISSGPYGIYYTGGTHVNTIIKYNRITQTTGRAITLDTCTGASVKWNEIKSNTGYGISLYWGSNINIFNNIISSNSGTGIHLYDSPSHTISNNTVKWNNGTYGGIFLEYANSKLNTISYNTVTGNSQDGIRIRLGTNNKVIFNNITGNAKSGGGYVGGIHLLEADYTTVANNSLFDNIRGITVDGWNDYCTIDNNTVNYSTVTGMVFSYSANNMVKHNTFYRNAGTGISLGNSDKNTMSRNVIKYSTGDGIYITVGGHRVLNNTITNNGFSGVNVTGNSASGNTPANLLDGNNVSYNGRDGITLWDSTSMSYHTYQNTISNNIARGNSRTGISLVGGTYKNILRYNNASGNVMHGISLDNAPDSTVINNTLAFNGVYGLYVTGTASSKIYHNNLLENVNQAYENGANIWNLGYAGGGNYWSDWISPDDFSGDAQTVAGADGFVDSPRMIPGGTNRDSFPWTTKNGWYGYVPTTGPVVNTNTGEFFFLIQDAINDPDTLNGHTITVGAGMYFETITVNKRLTIVGAGASVTTVRGGGSTDVITISANWVNISGVKVINGGSTSELAGIRLNSVQNCNISACTVTGNLRHGIMLNAGSLNSIYASTVSANAGNGIYVYSTSSNRIIGNTVEGNLGAEGGIYMTSATYNTISGNNIRNHPQSGVMGYNADYNQITWNTLTNNSKATSGYVYRSAIHLYQYSDYNRINNNTLTDNRIALGTQLSITYNVWDNNTASYSASSGMVLSYASNNLVKYCVFHHNAGNGISSGNSDMNTISRNRVYSNAGDGIGITVGGHKILNNTVTNNGMSGMNVTGNPASGNTPRSHLDGNNVSYNNRDGITLWDSTSWSYHVYFVNVTNNLANHNNRTGIYLVGGTYTNTLRGNVARNNLRWGIYLNNAPNCKILSNTLMYNTNDGLALFSSSGTTATGNNASSNGASGFILYSSTGCTLANNSLYSNYNFGFNIGTSSNGNTLISNTASKNSIGIYISWNSNSNTISKNHVNQNTVDGAYIDKSSSNTVFNNTFSSNSRWGLWFGWSGSSNKVYHNNFVGNNGGAVQAEDNMGTNLWDNGYPGGGNYWSNYPGIDAFSGASQNVPGSDGFGDTAYAFSGSQDRYPLMFQSIWWAEVAPTIVLVSPSDGSIIQAGTKLNFYVWDQDFNLDSATYAVGAGPDTAFGVNYDIDTAGWADGDYSVRVDADDKLGNTAQQTFSFRIDSTDPVFTVGSSISIDVGSNGFLDTGDSIAIWVNVTDLNEDATTVPSIDVDETGFQDQPVDALTYQGSGVWTCVYTVQAGGFNISNIDVSFADMAGNLASAPDSVTFSIRGSKQMGFVSGWNLISFPMNSPVINGAPIRRASDLANQTAPVMISKWNPATQSYMNFIPGFHLPTDPQNFAIGPDDAIFVFKSSAASYSAFGYKAPGQRSVNLLPGWNLVGYHAMTVGDVETDWAAQVTCGAMDDICYWDGSTFQHYIFAGTVMELTPGRGYFVWSDAATTLIY